ncbi:MAG: hypothetical protein ABIH66_09310, partial [bacterium]
MLRIGAVLAGCAFVAAAFVYIGRILPVYADAALREKLSEYTHYDFGYENLSVSLLAGVRLSGFTAVQKGGGPGCEVKTVDIRPSVLSLLSGRPEVKELILAEPHCRVAVRCDGKCDLHGLFEGLGGRKEAAARLPGIEVLNGRLSIEVSRGERVRKLLVKGLSVEAAEDARGVRGRIGVHIVQARGVSMRDVIAGFSYSGGKFHLKGFRGRVSSGRVSAVATVEPGKPETPFELKATMRGVPAAAAARLLGLGEGIVRGGVSGTVRGEGTFAGFLESEWDVKLRAPRASLKIPLRYGDEKPDEEDYLVLKRVRVELEGGGSGGEMELNGSVVNRWADFRLENSKFTIRDYIDGKDEPGVGFDVVVSGTVGSVKKIADGVTGFDIPFNGKMSTHLALAGNSSRPGGLAAKGTVVFSDGVIFQTISTDPSERERRKIAYDRMKMDYSYKDGVFNMENVVIRGGEIDFSAGGYVKFGGRIDVRGDAMLSPALAARVLGWELASDEALSGEAIPARFRLAGATNLPIVYWEPVGKPPAQVAAAPEATEEEAVEVKGGNVLEKIRRVF